MEERQPPIYIATLGRVYRRDTPSPTLTPNFHQVEALAVDRDITLADLKGTLLHFFRAMFGEDRDVRMRTSFFPFTEPSVEFDVTCFLCGGKGCAFCKYTGWFEMGGAGVVDPAVFENVGYDPEEWSRLRLGPRARPHRGAAPRHPRHPHVLGERPARPEAVLMRSRSAGCASTSPSTCRSPSSRDRLVISTLRGRRASRRAASPTSTATSGSSASAGCSRPASTRTPTGCSCARSTSGEGEPRQIVCGAWNFGAGATVARRAARRGAARTACSSSAQGARRGRDGMILAEDEVELGDDHAGIMVLPDEMRAGHAARATCCRSPTTSSSSRRATTGPICSPSTASPARSRRSSTSSWRRRREPTRSADGDEPVDITIDDFEGCPRYIGRLFRDVDGRAVAGLAQGAARSRRACGRSRTSST